MVADDRKYTREHEWIMVEGEEGTIGVTEYAASELGDVTYLELPEVGSHVGQGQPVGTIETVKSVEDLYCPVDGEVLAVNEAVLASPELVNSDPLGEGWLIKIRLTDPAQLDELLSAAEYSALIGS